MSAVMKVKEKRFGTHSNNLFIISVFSVCLCVCLEGSLHSSDSVSDSSPPPAVVQTGVPTQVVQQVQTAQQVKLTKS